MTYHGGVVPLMRGDVQLLSIPDVCRVCVSGEYLVLFRSVPQPAEESGAGAKAMVEDGALQHPDVDEIYGLHLYNYHDLGYVGVKHGPIMASSCRCVPRSDS